MVVIDGPSSLETEFLKELTGLRCADIWDLSTKIKAPEALSGDHGRFKESLYLVAMDLLARGVIKRDGKHAEELERKYREAGRLPESEIRYVIPYRIA